MDTSELGEDQNSVPYDFRELFCMTEDFDIGIFFLQMDTCKTSKLLLSTFNLRLVEMLLLLMLLLLLLMLLMLMKLLQMEEPACRDVLMLLLLLLLLMLLMEKSLVID